MQVLFKNSQGKIREIASFDTDGLTDQQAYRRAYKHIKDFCDDHSFHIYYSRLWNQDNKTIVDVGSHTEFFHIVPSVDFASFNRDGD